MPDNPFVTGPDRAIVEMAVTGVFNTGLVTLPANPEMTTDYVLLVGMSAMHHVGDELTGGHALLWQLADALEDRLSGNVEIETSCGHDRCTQINATHAAYLAAVGRGDRQAAMNVVKAAYKEAVRLGQDPARELLKLFVSLMVLVLGTIHSEGDSHHI